MNAGVSDIKNIIIHDHTDTSAITCLKGSPDADISAEESVMEETRDNEKEKPILCRNCGNPLTSRAFMTAVNGQNVHVFANPYGMVFEIACFARAQGCAAVGRASDEFSWFKGYTWRISVCNLCLEHNGWLFESGNNFFFGLITDRIIDS